MKNALILHGIQGNNKENWFPWLKEQLENVGFKVYLPNLPNADKPNLKYWLAFIHNNWHPDAASIIIGHSLGAVTSLKILEGLSKNTKVKLAILVSAFKDDIGWDLLTNFFSAAYDWEKIKNSSERIILFHSDNDPYVPLDHAHFLKEKLEADLVLIKNAGHFNTKSGYTQFPQLLEKIKENYPK